VETPKPYDVLARYYDRIMDHVDYEKWANYVLKTWKRLGVQPRNVLEVGAGSGRLSAYLSGYVDQYVISDLSHAMLKCAPKNSKRAVGDMRKLPFKNEWADSVLLLYDSINYMQSKAELVQCIYSVLDVLKPGGVFIFDICTLKNCMDHFDNTLSYEEYDDFEFVRESYFSKSSITQFNQFTFYIPHGKKGLVRKYREVHGQRIFAVDMVKKIVQSCMELKGVYSGFTFKVGSENSVRVHFVAVKA
jgi:ubiquinone/menaquinone biosynthesis C-methylase UbiE